MIEPGQLIANRFEIQRSIGAGGMGMVFRALDRTTGEVVALKTLLPEGEEGMELEARFLREGRLLSELRHPGVVRYVDSGRTEGGELYLAMEWVEGDTLSKRLKAGRMTEAEAVELAIALASALAAAHARGIIHRDLKPDNVLLPGPCARAKLCDFGIARHIVESKVLTKTETAIGTVPYMSPEQALGELNLDARADLYGLGALLYHCLSGHAPIRGNNTRAVLLKIVAEEPEPLRRVAPEVSPGIAALIDSLLEKEARDRPQTARAVLDVLQGLRPAAVAEALHPHSLTHAEQRLFSVVVGVEPSRGAPQDAAVARKRGREEVARLGAQLEQLADGSWVAIARGEGDAGVQVERALRCAQLMRSALRLSPVVIATGRGGASEALPTGEVIERAIRLLHEEAQRPSDGIRVDAVTAGLLRGGHDVETDARGGVVREENEPTLTGAGRARAQGAFVGRELELSQLAAAIRSAVEELTPHVTLVLAEAGRGKTRLLDEAVRRAHETHPRLRVLHTRCDPLASGSAFSLLAGLVRSAFAVPAGANRDQTRALLEPALRQRVGARGADATVAAFVELLCGDGAKLTSDATRSLAPGDASTWGDRLRLAALEWLAAEAAKGPLALWLDDLHWADAPSLEALEAAVEELESEAVVLLGAARPDVDVLFPNLWRRLDPQRLSLERLGQSAARQLARALLPSANDATLEELVSRSAGNALFLEELARAVRDGQPLPETLMAILQARLERLDPQGRRVLRACSILGDRFGVDAVQALLGDDLGEGTEDHLQLLVREDVLRDLHGGRYAFRHPLYREAAYGMLTDADRQLGHRLAARWLEERADADPQLVAEHFVRAGMAQKAVPFALQGARRAMSAHDLEAAVRLSRLVAEHAPKKSERLEGRLLEAEATLWRGSLETGTELAREVLAEAEERSEAYYGAIRQLARAAGRRADEPALRALRARLLDAPAHSPGAARATANVGIQLGLQGRSDLAEPLMHALSKARGTITDDEVRANVDQALAMHTLVCGRLAEGLALAERTEEAFRKLGDARNLLSMTVVRGRILKEVGLFSEARGALSAANATARKLRISALQAVALTLLAEAEEVEGRIEDALRSATDAARLAEQSAQPLTLALARVQLGAALIAAGRPDEAEPLLTGSVLPRARPRGIATWAQWLLKSGRAAEALGAIAPEAAGLAPLKTDAPVEALIRCVFGEALVANGQEPRAREVIAEAVARLGKTADAIGDAELRASFLNNVPAHARTLALAKSLGVPTPE